MFKTVVRKEHAGQLATPGKKEGKADAKRRKGEKSKVKRRLVEASWST